MTQENLSLDNQEPNWGPIGKDIFERTYSRVKPSGEKESWRDTVKRVVEGNATFVNSKHIELNEIEELSELFFNFKAIPAGRHLWTTGIKDNSFVMNCWITHWWPEFSRHFSFLFERLMEGGGVGANYSNKYLKQYSAFTGKTQVHLVCNPTHKDYETIKDRMSTEYSHEWAGTNTIPDSRRGWVEALVKVIEGAYKDSEEVIVFDVSQVRPAGSAIKTFGGTASGPGPLVDMLMAVSKKLNSFHGKRPASLLCMEIDHEIGRCVVSGNVRRSARMSMKHWADDDIMSFLTCKNLDADGMARDHWTTNISVIVDNRFFRKLKEKDLHAKKVAKLWAKGQLANGEPGFFNVSKASIGELSEIISTNPCVPADSWVMTSNGPKQVNTLIGKKFTALVNGSKWDSSELGFFSTGVKTTLLIKSEQGYQIELTDNHPVYRLPADYKTNSCFAWEQVNAGEVKNGDKLKLSTHTDEFGELVQWNGNGTVDQGWLLGLLIGDGCISNDKAHIDAWGNEKSLAIKAADILKSTTIYNFGPQIIENADKIRVTCVSLKHLCDEFGITNSKVLTSKIEDTSTAFYKGFLRGFFDTDGSVQGTKKKGVSVRLAQSDLNRLQVVQRMLLRLGIYSGIYENRRDEHQTLLPDGNGGEEWYDCKAQHELIISNDQLSLFDKLVGFEAPEKKARLKESLKDYKRKLNRTWFVATVSSVQESRTIEVYDCQIPGINRFDSQGFYVHNCGEVPMNLPGEACNLGHVNLASYHNDQSGYLKAARLMTRFLIRATFADFPDETARQAVHTNRRIGVGFFGFHEWLVMQGIKFSECHENQDVRKFLRKAYEVIRKEARDYSYQLRIPEPVKVTTLAPTGSIAKLPGQTEGGQSILYDYFIRGVNFSRLDPTQAASLERYKLAGEKIEDSLYTDNTSIVYFYMKEPLIDKALAAGIREDVIEVAEEIHLEDQLAVQAMIQEEYADNAISFTINFDKDKYKVGEFLRALKTWGPRLKGTTLMPTISNRPQMPYKRITKEEYEAATNRTAGQVEMDCVNGCPIR